jgi:hypothetical protein
MLAEGFVLVGVLAIEAVDFLAVAIVHLVDETIESSERAIGLHLVAPLNLDVLAMPSRR